MKQNLTRAIFFQASSDQVARLWDLSQGETVRHYSGTKQEKKKFALHFVKKL